MGIAHDGRVGQVHRVLGCDLWVEWGEQGGSGVYVGSEGVRGGVESYEGTLVAIGVVQVAVCRMESVHVGK